MIHPRIQAAIDRYVRDRIRPGSFLTSVLKNDLHAAIACGDDEAIRNLKDIVTEVYCRQPPVCSGSHLAVEAWLDIDSKRLKSLEELTALDQELGLGY